MGPLLPYLLPPSPSSPHPPPPHVKPLVIIFILQDGWSPLMRVSFNGALDLVKTLIKARANVNHINKVSK